MAQNPQYIDRKTVNASYRPKNSLMSPGLKRAREPYRVRNALTGLVLGGLAVGIWAYSISAVKQDVFDDVDEEARVLVQSGGTVGVLSLEDEKRAMEAASAMVVIPGAGKLSAQQPTLVVTPPAVLPDVQKGARGDAGLRRGVLVKLLGETFPGLFDPKCKTLVWGAPPVDNIGRMRLRSSAQ